MPHRALSHTDLLHPTLTLQISAGDKNQQSRVIPALIDTGFDSYLCLPKSVVEELHLEVIGEDEIEIANGQNFLVNICVAKVVLPQFGNIGVEVECIISDDGEALFGTKLLEVFFEFFQLNFKEQNIIFEIKADF